MQQSTKISIYQYQVLIDAVAEPVLILNHERKIIMYNIEFENTFKLTKNTLLNNKFETLMLGIDRNQLIQHHANFINSTHDEPKNPDLITFIHYEQNKIIPIKVSYRKLAIDNSELVVAIVQPICDINLNIDKILSTVAHELCSPLNAIIGFTGTLLMQLPGPLNNEQLEQLTTVKESAKFQLSLINDLAELAKISLGKITPVIDQIDCCKLINQILIEIQPTVESKKLNIHFHIPDKTVTIQSDSQLLSKILTKLLNNAIKFTKSGSITIQIETTVHKFIPYLIIHIDDTGIGIKDQDQIKLFQPFQKINVPGEHYEGSGLGLYASQQLAKLLGGKIECSSKYGAGSRFSIMLPVLMQGISENE